MRVCLIPLVTVLLAACSSSPPTRAARDCGLSAADSAFVGTRPLFRDCQVHQVAKAVTTPLDLPAAPTGPDGPTCYRAEVQFVVGADGVPERNTIRLVSGGGDFFANAVVASVPNWRYSPALLDGTPVRQLVRERKVLETRVRVSTPQGSMRREVPGGCR